LLFNKILIINKELEYNNCRKLYGNFGTLSMEISFQIWKFSFRYTENQNMRMEALQICHIVHIFWHGIPLLCLFWYNISIKSLFDVQITSNITTNNKFIQYPS
jgi:hypothetical protein